MKLKELLNYVDCVPVDPEEGQTHDDALLNMDIHLRVRYASGQYNQITDICNITVENLPGSSVKAIILNTERCG